MKISIFRVSEIASGAICEEKMHNAEVVALCIIKSVCGLLKVLVVCFLTFRQCMYKSIWSIFHHLFTDSACTTVYQFKGWLSNN